MVDLYPIDFTSDIGRVRKYIPDLVQAADPSDPLGEVSFLWSDEQLQSFVDDEALGVSPAPIIAILRASAYAMIATANSEAMILKKITTEDLQTDGASVSKAMLANAQALLGRANTIEADVDESAFLIVTNPTHGAYDFGTWYGVEGTENQNVWG